VQTGVRTRASMSRTLPLDAATMSTITVEEAQAQLPELLARLNSGEEVVITRKGKRVAQLLPPELPKGVPIAGRRKGKVIVVSEDDHLQNFAEYME
jgi:prevent-host-death family protein